MTPAIDEISTHACTRDAEWVAIPRPEVQIAARFGPTAKGGLELAAFGGRQKVFRKTIRCGHTVVFARLRLGAGSAVLGVTAGEMAGRLVDLDLLWGASATARLREQLAGDPERAPAILEAAITARFTANARARNDVALRAAARMADGSASSIQTIAGDLGISERHLRRVFREAVGVSPKEFAKLTRFRRALRAATTNATATWAAIAASAGYYDQAHLIAEFRAIAGVTPPTLLAEMRV